MIELSPGTVVANRYELTKLIGEGGMGQVWAGFHCITKKRVALKFLKTSAGGTLQTEKVVRRFLREARAVSAVNHPNVVQVHDVFQQEDGNPVMVLDLLTGEDLGQKLEREKRVDLGELVRLILPVISAVGTAHAAGIVHRDLKPDNIFLHQRVDGQIEPRVLDFGIAKLSAKEGEAAETANLTQTGAVMGTPYYMPPEQVFGEKDIDQRADVWAMGVILYECISGVKPIDGENFGQLFKAITLGEIRSIAEVAPGIPEDVAHLVHRMLQSDRTQRCYDLQDAYEVLSAHAEDAARSFGRAATALPNSTLGVRPEGVLDSGSVDGLARTQSTIPGLPSRRTRPIALAAAAVLVLGLGAGGVVLWSRDGNSVHSGRAAAVDGAPSAQPKDDPMLDAGPPAAKAAGPEVLPVEASGSAEAEEGDAGPKPPAATARTAPRQGPLLPKVGAEPPAAPEPAPKPPVRGKGEVVEDLPF